MNTNFQTGNVNAEKIRRRSFLRRSFLALVAALAASLVASSDVASSAAAADPAQILIVVGPSTHPPGTHEVAAGARLIQASLGDLEAVPNLEVNIVEGWPEDDALLEKADTIVFTGDTFPPARLPETKKIFKRLGELMDAGCSIVCIHYSTGLWGQDVRADGDHPMLRWLGGYFANKTCPHHQGIARVYKEATITPNADHPICRGWDEFTLNDEPYINNYFGPNDNQPAPNVTVLATSMLPPEAPRKEPVAWCIERPDGGRGFSIVMPHFYKNWGDDDLRCFIFNGIVWSAGLEIPPDGVQTKKPDLPRFLAVKPEK